VIILAALSRSNSSREARKAGQGGSAETEVRDLRAELLKAEAAHFAKKSGKPASDDGPLSDEHLGGKRALESGPDNDDPEEDPEVERRRLILEEAREIDADSDGGSSDSSDEGYGLCSF
jgi:protein CWC15